MKILITGATGFIGTELTHKCLDLGHEVHVLTRNIDKAKAHFNREGISYFQWNNTNEVPPQQSLMNIDGIVHLMGENIGEKRWTEEQKRKLRQSRIDSTENLMKAILEFSTNPLRFFVSASAIGIYPVNLKRPLDEESETGLGFLAQLCKDWEKSSEKVKSQRRVILRTGVVLEKNGGALHKMLLPFKLGLGGPIGDGKQIMSWIHRDDLVNLYLEAIHNEKMQGIYNAVAPETVDNFQFTKALGYALHRPTLIPVPKAALKLALGEMSTIVLDSQNIVTKRLQEINYSFKYPTLEKALYAIFERKHEKKSLLDSQRPKTA